MFELKPKSVPVIIFLLSIILSGYVWISFLEKTNDLFKENKKNDKKIVKLLKNYINQDYKFELDYPKDMIIKELTEENCELRGKAAQISFNNSDVKIYIEKQCGFEPFGNPPNILPPFYYSLPFSGPSTSNCSEISESIKNSIIECININEHTRQIFAFYGIPNLLNSFSAIL